MAFALLSWGNMLKYLRVYNWYQGWHGISRCGISRPLNFTKVGNTGKYSQIHWKTLHLNRRGSCRFTRHNLWMFNGKPPSYQFRIACIGDISFMKKSYWGILEFSAIKFCRYGRAVGPFNANVLHLADMLWVQGYSPCTKFCEALTLHNLISPVTVHVHHQWMWTQTGRCLKLWTQVLTVWTGTWSHWTVMNGADSY